jgi:hypothetical protein
MALRQSFVVSKLHKFAYSTTFRASCVKEKRALHCRWWQAYPTRAFHALFWSTPSATWARKVSKEAIGSVGTPRSNRYCKSQIGVDVENRKAYALCN